MIFHVAAKEVFAHMLELWPEEVCGLIWDDGTITRLRNQAASPSRFSVGQTQLAEALAAQDPNEKLLAAVYHSHPNGSIALSDEDRTQMSEMWKVMTVPWAVATRTISDGISYDQLFVWSINPDKWLYVKERVIFTGELSNAL